MMDVISVLAVNAAAAALLALTVIDLRHARLPDGLNFILVLSGIAFHAASPNEYATWPELLLGAALGAGLFYLLRGIYLRLRGIEAIGLGDVKFMAAAGCWVGIWGIAPLILIAAATTLVVVCLQSGGLSTALKTQRRIPFGPGLALGLVAVMMAGYWGVWPA